jgi:hypothetical protein
VVGPGGARAGGGGGQDDPPPPLGRQVQVALAKHDRLRRAQRGVVQAGVERFQVLPAVAQCPDGGEEAAGLGGADHHPPVDTRLEADAPPSHTVIEYADRSAAHPRVSIRVARPGLARDRGSAGYTPPGRPRLTVGTSRSHLTGEALDEDQAPQEELVSRRRPVAELWNIRPSRGSTGEGDSPSRSSMSQAIFHHRVAGGRGCRGEA